MISVLILTLNEEDNLARCLDSVKWSDDVVVLDSYSSDRTAEIARDYGARVVFREFDNEASHRAYSIHNIPFRYTWVYNPDADEVTKDELRDEMLSVVQHGDKPEVAYRVRFKTMFMGRWLRHSGLYPTWVVRLFRPEFLSFERQINLRYVIDGPVGDLNGHFYHYTFNKGLEAWFAKHNWYSSKEAEESLASLANGDLDWRGLLASRDPVRRRRALKEWSFRMPCRPTLRFLYMYLLRCGFLDGRAGFTYCRLLAMYEYMIVLKLRELRRREQGLPV